MYTHTKQVQNLALEAGKLVMVPQPRLRTGPREGMIGWVDVCVRIYVVPSDRLAHM